MDCKEYGGVGAKEVIVFQTKIMMGAQFGRILWAREHASDCLAEGQDEILMACLRMGWNDAFRHTSKNERGINDEKRGLFTIKGEVSTYTKKEKYKKSIFKLFRGKIKRVLAAAEFDDFFTDQVLSRKEFLDIFKEYVGTQGAKDTVITSNFPQIQRCFAGVKKMTGKQALSFGHIQKLFNIAIKLYLCLYICREELELKEDLFVHDIVMNFVNADCPIDSIILGELDQIEMYKAGEGAAPDTVYGGYTWSQLDSADYVKIQDRIEKECEGKSRLWFDFHNWN